MSAGCQRVAAARQHSPADVSTSARRASPSRTSKPIHNEEDQSDSPAQRTTASVCGAGVGVELFEVVTEFDMIFN